MTRKTNAVASHRRKKRIAKRAKGFWGDRKNHHALTKEAVVRAMANNYRDRKMKKRDFRSLWITRIGIASKLNGISYSKLMHGLKLAGCELNRKVLANLAIVDPLTFKEVVGQAVHALAKV